MTLKDVQRRPKSASIWDPRVDMEKVQQLSPEDKNRLFPNDFSLDGTPRGDF